MVIFFGILVGLIVLWFYLFYRKAILKIRYQEKLFRLKAELQTYVEKEVVDTNSWAVTFLDRSITKAASNLNNLNFHAAWGLDILYARDKRLLAFASKFQAEINRPANASLRIIYHKLGTTIIDYVIKKHKIFRQVFLKVHQIKEYRNYRNRSNPPSQILEKIRKFRIYPETSASRDFFDQ